MPTPTVVRPAESTSFNVSREIFFTGLSWNDTKVDVYIDGSYGGRADLRTDESGVGNFVFRPLKSLAPGAHTMYTVAWNLSELERSRQSTVISFVLMPAQEETLPVQESVGSGSAQAGAEEVNQEGAFGTLATSTSANEILSRFFNQATSSTATTTSWFHTPVGIGTTIVIILFIIIAVLALKLLQDRLDLAKAREGTDDDLGPPEAPPPPPPML